jgi:ubiquinone/menaquinone biosynthesis C-methylase UbiE
MQWDDIFRDARYTELPPADEVVEFIPLLAGAPGKQVLDHGCGAGRHTLLLAREGYDVSGLDISPRGCQLTRERLHDAGLEANITVGDMTALPYGDGSFDALISRGVITHGRRAKVHAALREIERVLRPGSLILCTFISTRSSLMGAGSRIDAQTWVCDDDLERGVVHHFMTCADVGAATADAFETLACEHYEHGGLIDSGRPYVSAHWIFTGRRR